MQSLLACHASGSELIKVQQTNPTKCACSMNYVVLPSLKLTASLHLKKWWLEDEKILLGPGLSSGAVAMLVSGRVSPDDYHFPSQIMIQFFFFRGRRAVTVHFWGGKVYTTFLSKNERPGSEKAFPGAKSPCLISTSF